jgi:hypothetical protein
LLHLAKGLKTVGRKVPSIDKRALTSFPLGASNAIRESPTIPLAVSGWRMSISETTFLLRFMSRKELEKSAEES